MLVAHHAKFELGWLMREKLPWDHLLVWDTMIAELVKYGNNPERKPLSLGACCKRRGLATKDPLVDAMLKGGVCPSQVPERLLEGRCIRDVETTHLLYKEQYLELGAKKRNVVFTRCIFTPVLAAIEREGMQLDAERVYLEYQSCSRRAAELEKAMAEIAGGRNLRSPPQLAEVLYDILKFPAPKKRGGDPVLTPRGWRPTSKDALRDLKPRTKKQEAFLALRKEYGKVNARLTKVLRFFKAVCDEREGRFYANFHQTRTATHRTSSTSIRILFPGEKKPLGVQMQNLPREYKRLFKSPWPDWLIAEADGSQLEFRVAGELGNDAQVLEDVLTDKDVHRFSASVLYNKTEDKIGSVERTAAKPETFKPLYGGEFGSPPQMAYYKAFREKYNGVYRTQMGWVSKVLKDKEITMPWGMTFYFPKAKLGGTGYCRDKPSIFNYPVQNLATAEIIPISLTFLFWFCRLEGIRVRFINTVHDSVIALVHKDDYAKYKTIAKRAFLGQTYDYLANVYGLHFKVPLGLGIKAGEHWGEGEEEKFTERVSA